MRDQLSVQFVYSPREHVMALDETPYRRLLKKWWVPGSIAFVTLMFGRTAFRKDLFEGSPSLVFWVVVFAFLPMLVTLLMTPSIMRRFEMARYRRARTAYGVGIETRRFGSDGITQDEGIHTIPWSMITRVIETDNFYLFYHALSDTPDYLPKRTLTRSDADTLRSLLHDQFQSRSRDLLLLPRAT